MDEERDAGGPLRVGLYGANGHQIQAKLLSRSDARLVAAAGVPDDAFPEAPRGQAALKRYGTLDELLADPDVDLVSLCSPRRDQQAEDAIKALRRGKHVYAEKPCAPSEGKLEQILAAARNSGRRFREMGDTLFEASGPWYAMRELVRSGAIGDVVQIHAQKSYPWHDRRPVDDGVDGGLVAWVGVHGFRWIEHIGGSRVKEVLAAAKTPFGAPAGRGTTMAAACLLALENGGVATLTTNYLNPRKFGAWGNEALRIFGAGGMAEITDGGARSRWFDADGDRGPIPPVETPDYFARLMRFFRHGEPMPFSLEEDLHPTRVALRAGAMAKRLA